MFRRIPTATVLAFLTCTAFSVPRPASLSPNPQPTEVKIVSVPTAQPTEVKIISTPPSSPAEVKIVSAPPDQSANAMVRLTLWILIANAALCLITFIVGMRQSGDTKRSIGVSAQAAAAATASAAAAVRSADAAKESVDITKQQERAMLEREVNRAAHKVMATATRLEQVALQVPQARTQLHILCGQGGMPDQIKEQTEQTLRDRRARIQDMSSAAHATATSSLTELSDKELTTRLWRLDEHQVQLEVMRESFRDELNSYETESLTRRQQQTMMQAAALGSKLAPRNTLG